LGSLLDGFKPMFKSKAQEPNKRSSSHCQV